MQSTKRGEGVEMLSKLIDSDNAAIRKWATNQLATKAGYSGEGQGKPPAKGAAAKASPTRQDWENARKSVAVGESYVGPDGLTYTRRD